jgi:hypothetical protein
MLRSQESAEARSVEVQIDIIGQRRCVLHCGVEYLDGYKLGYWLFSRRDSGSRFF